MRQIHIICNLICPLESRDTISAILIVLLIQNTTIFIIVFFYKKLTFEMCPQFFVLICYKHLALSCSFQLLICSKITPKSDSYNIHLNALGAPAASPLLGRWVDG